MYRLDDFMCTNSDCDEFNLSVSILEDDKYTPTCQKCNKSMMRLIGAPMGIVRGTQNPVTYIRRH